jgi:hypothetical protein
MAGFSFIPIDRFMRSRIAPWLLPVFVLALLAFLAAAAAGKELTLYRMFATVPVAILGLVTVLSWRRLWRTGRDGWETVVYDYGVRGFGATMWACSAGGIVYLSYVMPPVANDALSNIVWRTSFVSALTFSVAGTACLWAGYLWGVAMAAVSGAEASAPKGTLPPAVCRT